MADDRVTEAVDILARGLIVRLAEGDIGEAWGDWLPDVGEDDFYAIRNRAEQLLVLSCPTREAYNAAYDFIAARANHE